MVYTFKQRIRSRLLAISVIPFYLISRRGYLKRMGWYKSLRKNCPVDSSGKPIPWWSYSSCIFLQDRLNPNLSVFEYGSGYSTLWLASRVRNVYSVEYDKSWHDKLQREVPANVRMHFCAYKEDGEYCRLIQQTNRQFDIIVIDGLDRIRCARNAVGALTPDGVIVFDDAHQTHLKEGRDYLKDQGFRKIDFYGMGPMHDGTHCTTIFYKNKNCLGI